MTTSMMSLSSSEEALKELEEGIQTIMTEEGFQQWLEVLSRFSSYSFNNITMIARQRPDATRVAGYRAWQQKFNRQVNKGAQSIAIFAPMIYSKEDSEGNKQSEIKGFKIVRVFDYADTQGDPLPEAPAEVFLHGASSVSASLLPLLKGVLAAHDLRYERKKLAPVRGVFNPLMKTIATDEDLELDMEVKVLTHEIVHYLAGHGSRLAEYKINREEIESVTESVAFVTLHHFGLDTGDASFNYVAHWAKDIEVVKRNLRLIQKVSQTVIEEVESQIRSRYTVEAVAA